MKGEELATLCSDSQIPGSFVQLAVREELSSNRLSNVFWNVLVGKLGYCLERAELESSSCHFARSDGEVRGLFS